MSTAFFVAACLFALPLSSAFHDSSPLVAWSSQRSSVVVPEDVSLPLLLENDALCSFESVVIIDQPGVRRSDLRGLHASSVLSANLNDAPFSFQAPYSWTLSTNDLASAVEGLASRCEAQLAQFDAQHNNALPQLEDTRKHVIYAQFPSLPDGLAWERKQMMSEQEGTLSSLITSIASAAPDSLFIFTGSAPFIGSELKKRQVDSTPFAFAPSNSTTGGILSRYQLLTPGLILTLAVVLFVALPIVFFGISALSQIQSPVSRIDMKGPSLDKKNQ